MTTIAKDIAAKLSVAVVALAMAFAAFAPAAQAQSAEELQEMINDLLAQIAQLEGTTSGDMACGHFYTDLSMGSTGADVKMLQEFLNMDPDTRVAASGVGSAGMETEYYGALTAAAVSKFQVKYRSEILTPLSLVNPTGYFGASSRAVANDMCADGDMDDDEDMDEDDDDDRGELSGEGTLETLEIDDDEDPEEGEEDVVVMVVTLEADDGDLELDRMTFTASSTAGSETDPWDVFETISLWVDGDMIADFDAEDEDEYLDEDAGEFRFTDLELILEEGEEMEVEVAVSVQNGVDDAGTAAWDLTLDEIRYFDADGVATDEDDFDELGAPVNGTVNFEIEEEGEGDELEINSSSEDPDSTTFTVEEDSESDEMIFAFELDADNSDSDIEIDDIVLAVSGTAVDSDGDNLEDFVGDFWIEIDGEMYDAEDYDGDGNTENLTFEVDGDFTLDMDEDVVVYLYAEFDIDDDFTSATITAETVSVEGEGADDLTVTNTISGEEHDVITEGIVVPADGVETSTDTSGDNDDIGEFEIEFEVTAYENDFYITDNATLSSTTPAVEDGAQFSLQGPTAGTVDAVVDAVLTSTGDEDTDGVFTVEEGETETFTLTVTVDTDTTGQYRVVLDEVWFSSETDGEDGEARVLTPASDYRTGYETIQAS